MIVDVFVKRYSSYEFFEVIFLSDSSLFFTEFELFEGGAVFFAFYFDAVLIIFCENFFLLKRSICC